MSETTKNVDDFCALAASGLINRLVDDKSVKATQTAAEIDAKQNDLTEKFEAENEKFRIANEEFKLDSMVKTTKIYSDKLFNLTREMAELTQRGVNLKARAVKLMEAKQKEALKREQRRQRQQEIEEQLTARHAEDC